MKKGRWIITLCLACVILAGLGLFLCHASAEDEKKEPPKTKYYSGEAIEGAVLQLIDKDGKVVKEWTTTKVAYEIGAELVAGETYTLHEKSAPPGYLLAEDITFTVPLDGKKQEITMVDAPTSVEIEKKDKDTAKPVYNAVLQVLDEDGTVMDEWTTDGTIHEVKGILTAGKKYIIHEKTTPVGYKQSDDVSFIAPTEEPPYKVTFYNVQILDDVPKTGDTTHVYLWGGIVILSVAGIIVVTVLRRRMH
jgi:LPXTG-motif cell wall-anchored protein